MLKFETMINPENRAEDYQFARAKELGLPVGTGKRYSEEDLTRFIDDSEASLTQASSARWVLKVGKEEKTNVLPVRRGDIFVSGCGVSYEIDGDTGYLDDEELNALDEVVRWTIRSSVSRAVKKIHRNPPNLERK